jgi:hypothetical protein
MPKFIKHIKTLLLAVTLVAISCNNNQPVDSKVVADFFEYFSNNENVKVVTLNPKFYKNFINEEKELHSMMDNITDMKLMVTKKNSAESASVKENFEITTQKGNFKKILEVENDNGTTVSGFMRKSNNSEKDFICEVNENDLYIVLSLTGNIDEGKLLQIVQDPSLKTFERSTYLRF